MKRPAFQFYPADWRKDSALQSCSLSAQGLWINLLCIMHECDRYGHLSINDKPMQAAQLARLVGLTPKECAALLDELEGAGVFSRLEDGTVFSRRMVKDERIRNVRAQAGRLGGNPNLVKQSDNQTVNHTSNQDANLSINLMPTPSSSSSSSKDKSMSPVGFDSFWSAWPTTPRKQGRSKCLAVWSRKKLEARSAEIIAHVEAMKATDSWRGGYEPMPMTYLNQERWDGAESTGTKEEIL